MKIDYIFYCLLAFVFLFFIFGCLQGEASNAKVQYLILPSNISINLEIASTEAQMQKGLMFRQSLGEREGMIFLLGKKQIQGFWMFNTKIPLELIYLDENMKIVDIQEMEPCFGKKANECPSYVSKEQAMYAIELNKDFSKRYGVKIGDKIVEKS